MAKQQKMKALSAAGRSGWVTAKFESKERKEFCVDNLLFGCPVPGVSAAGRKIPALERPDNSLAAQMLDDLLEGLGDNCYYSNELRQIAKRLIDSKRAGNNVPNNGIEFAYFTKSSYGILQDTYGLFPGKLKKEIVAADANPYSSILVLDALYRHLRNGIAHGSFTEVKRKSPVTGKREAYLYLQDTNGKGQITARLFFSHPRIERIAKLASEA